MNCQVCFAGCRAVRRPRPVAETKEKTTARARAAPTSSAALRVGASFASLLSDQRLPRPKAVEAAGAIT